MDLAFIKNGWKLIHSCREIRRGRKKGLFEITYRKGSKFKKALVSKNLIREGGESNKCHIKKLSRY